MSEETPEDLIEMHDDAGEDARADSCAADSARASARLSLTRRHDAPPVGPELELYAEFRAAAIAMKQANLTAIAAAERYKRALAALSEAVAP